MGTFEFREHTADIIVRAGGATMAEAFAAAGEALFAVITDGKPIGSQQPVTFEVESIDREGLLVGFLSQLIVFHEADNLVLDGFKVTFESDHRLHVVCGGEPFNETRHGQGTAVKGISYHLMEIVEDPAGNACYVQVLFDI